MKLILKALGFILLGVVCLFICYFLFAVYMHRGFPMGSSVSFTTTFNNEPSGGTLLFVRPDSRKPLFFSIETQSNDPLSSVVDQLASAFLHSDSFSALADYMSEEELKREKKRYAKGNILRLPNGVRFFLAGTETGLGIPKPVTSVSCSFDSLEDHIKVFWENPSPEEYDFQRLYFRWTNLKSGRPEFHVRQDQVQGDVSSFSLRRVLFPDLPPMNIDDLDVLIVGYKNGIPSNAAGIHFNNTENTQEELCEIPFRNGIAPNWMAWGLQNSNEFVLGKEVFQERKREIKTQSKQITGLRIGPKPIEPVHRYGIKKPSEKPFVQILKIPETGGCVGLWRKFLMLSPEHTYRLTVRANTHEMDASSNNDWSFSVHMAHNNLADTELNERQLTGLEILPNGSKGLDAGQIALFNTENTTQGKYVERSGEITLPEGVDTVTVWLRHSSDKATSGVGIDWIQLEDLGK